MSFATAGLARGRLQFQEKDRKRRAEVAKMFDEYKRNNPYATADDYESFIESQVGSDELYLRRRMPSRQILERMGQDNQIKKQNEEDARLRQVASEKLAFANSVRESARSIAREEDDNMTVMKLLSQATGQPLDWVTDHISAGELDKIRNEDRTDEMRKAFNHGKGIIDSGGELDFDANDLGLGLGYDVQSMPWMKSVGEQLRTLYQRREENRSRKIELEDKTRRTQFYSAVDSDRDLFMSMTPGSPEYENAKQYLKDKATDYQLDLSDEEVTRILSGKQAMRAMSLQNQYTKSRAAAATKMQESLTAQFAEQEKTLGYLANSLEDENAAGVVGAAAQEYLMSPKQQGELIAFVRKHYDALGESTAAEFFRRVKARGEQLISRADIPGIVNERVDKVVTKPQTRDEFVNDTERGISRFGSMLDAGLKQVDADLERIGERPLHEADLTQTIETVKRQLLSIDSAEQDTQE